MTNFEVWQMIIGSGGILGIIAGIVFLVFRTGRIVEKINTIEIKMNTTDEKLEIFKKEIREDIRRLQSDISDIKERVTFMEAFMFFSEFKAESGNSRSELMKESWKKRKMKQLEAKEK